MLAIETRKGEVHVVRMGLETRERGKVIFTPLPHTPSHVPEALVIRRISIHRTRHAPRQVQVQKRP